MHGKQASQSPDHTITQAPWAWSQHNLRASADGNLAPVALDLTIPNLDLQKASIGSHRQGTKKLPVRRSHLMSTGKLSSCSSCKAPGTSMQTHT